MAAAKSAGSILLHGAGEDSGDLKAGSSFAILLKLNDSVLKDLKKASNTQDGLYFAAGSNPVRMIPAIGEPSF